MKKKKNEVLIVERECITREYKDFFWRSFSISFSQQSISYYNAVTGETTWERPSGPPAPPSRLMFATTKKGEKKGRKTGFG